MNRADLRLVVLLLVVPLFVVGAFGLVNAQPQQKIYFPVILKPGLADPYFPGPKESEPNNSSAQANGPLRPNFTYTGYPNDAWDIFSLAVTQPGKIIIEVKGHAVDGGQLQLRRAGERDVLAIDTSPPDYRIEYNNASPGTYLVYVFVDTEKSFTATQPYTIKAMYPTAPVPTVTPTRPGPTPTATSTPQPTATATIPSSGIPTLRNPGFELGDNGDWGEYSSNGYRLIVTSDDVPNVDAHNGQYLAWLGGLDDEVSVLWQQVAIPTNAPSFYLYFYFQIQSKETNCSTTNTPDSVWLVIDDEFVEGYVLCQENATAGWSQGVFETDLRAWRGKTVDLQIAVFTDDQPDTFSNFFVDDLSFSQTPPGPNATPTPTPTATLPPSTLPTIRNAGFEAGSNGVWEEYSSQGYRLIVTSDEVMTLDAYQGQYLAWLGGVDDEVSILSQSIAIPANVPSFYLYLNFYTESNEPNCSTSNTPDSVWLAIGDEYLEGYVLCENLATNQWLPTAFGTDLSGWKGQTVDLRLLVFTDSASGTLSSFFADELYFSKTVPTAGESLPARTVSDPRPLPEAVTDSHDSDRVETSSERPAPADTKIDLAGDELLTLVPRAIFVQPVRPEFLRAIRPIPSGWSLR